MIDRRSLAKALGKQAAIDWVLVERDQDLAIDHAGDQREEHRTRWQLTIHADTTGGRGSTTVMIDANEGDADRIVEQAARLARLSVGPAWASVPQAAPARVELEDPALADLREGIARLRAAIPRRSIEGRPIEIDATLALLHEHVTVQTKPGFQAEWKATHARVELVIATAEHSLAITRDARRLADLELPAAIDGAIDDLKLIATATAPPLGPCGLVFTADAALYGEYGVWQAFVDQADATVGRQGLTRYHEGSAIAPGADRVAEPLDVTSNGALAFGTRSAPVGDAGDAVREFALVANGIAGSPGLSPREAALAHREPNGGVRNLIINSGTWSGQPPEASGRILEIRRLRGLEIDPYTGDADVEIGLGVDHSTGSPFAGGTLRLDLIASLARARRSKTRIRRGAYEGPSLIFIDRATLI